MNVNKLVDNFHNRSGMVNTNLNVMHHFHQYYKGAHVVIYGSILEIDYPSKDIDVLVVGSTEPSGQASMNLPGIQLPLDVQFCTEQEYQAKRDALDVIFLNCWKCDVHGEVNISHLDDVKLFTDDLQKTRAAISKTSSAAWAKGHKKLTVLADYDQVLGIKNLAHSIRFPYLAMEYKVSSEVLQRQEATQELLDLVNTRADILSKYYAFAEKLYSTDASTADKWEALKAYTQPLYNATMTEFRKYFPKGSK